MLLWLILHACTGHTCKTCLQVYLKVLIQALLLHYSLDGCLASCVMVLPAQKGGREYFSPSLQPSLQGYSPILMFWLCITLAEGRVVVAKVFGIDSAPVSGSQLASRPHSSLRASPHLLHCWQPPITCDHMLFLPLQASCCQFHRHSTCFHSCAHIHMNGSAGGRAVGCSSENFHIAWCYGMLAQDNVQEKGFDHFGQFFLFIYFYLLINLFYLLLFFGGGQINVKLKNEINAMEYKIKNRINVTF